MVGFYTGMAGSLAVEEQGIDAIAAPTGEVLSATAGSALAHDITPRIIRSTLGGGPQAEEWGTQTGDSHIANIPLEQAPRDYTEKDVGERSAILEPENATHRYGIPGILKFDTRVPEAVAVDLYEHKKAEILRQNIISRREGGVSTSIFTRGVVGLAMGLLDPINLAAGLVPGFGEARVASAFGLNLAESLGARVTARAVSGASGGAAGMTALEPFGYLLDQHEQNDWTMGEAARNIAFGALLGAGLHTAIGGVFGRVPERIRNADPETQAMALRGAVAQVAEGRQVDIASALDFVEANAARRELEMFHRRALSIEAEIDAARAEVRITGPSPVRLSEAEAHLERAHERAAELRTEMEQAHTAARVHALDETSRVRLDEIDAELDRTIPRARREALEQERTMLMEGRGDVDIAGAGLEAARSRSEAQGLGNALTRAEQEIADLQRQTEKLTRSYQSRQAVVEANREAAEASARIIGAKAEGQQNLLQGLTERTVRRYAASIGVALEENEARSIAREVLAAQPHEGADIIAHALNNLAARSPRPEIGAIVDRMPPLARLAAEEGLADRTLRDNALRPPVQPDVPISARTNAVTREQAPKVEGPLDKQIVEAQKSFSEFDARVKAELDSGRLTEADMAPLRAADVLSAEAEQDAKAYEAAAACLASRIV